MKNAKNLSRRRKAKKVARIDEENGDIATVAGFILCLEFAGRRVREKEEREEKGTKERTKAS
jgi:hypothetical protein